MSPEQAMKHKAIETAQSVYDALVVEAEAEGQSLTQPWAKIREVMAADPVMSGLVEHLPGRLDRAIKRARKPRKIVGRPSNLAKSLEPVGGGGSENTP